MPETLDGQVITDPARLTFEPADRLRAIVQERRQRNRLVYGPCDEQLCEALSLIADAIEALAIAQVRR
jgi:hypothetical protein